MPSWAYYVLGAVAAAALAAGWWLAAPGPRRRRGCRKVQRLLGAGQWREALRLVQQISRGRLSRGWRARVQHLEGECQRAAMSAALAAREFETGLQHALKAAQFMGKSEGQAGADVVQAMLVELRRQFAASRDTEPLHDLIRRVVAVQSPCPEASFWQGLCHIREGKIDEAMASLQAARAEELSAERDAPSSRGEAPSTTAHAVARSAPLPAIDPPLYLGALLLRQDAPKEALRHLTEANRIDGGCPFVGFQLGQAMLAAGSDPSFAVRALQRALGPRGFAQWQDRPARAWIEGMPEHHSYIRRLAEKHIFPCPLWGADLRQIVRQASMALADGLYRLGQYQESRDTFAKLMQETAPTLPVLRGYGLALARLGEYDEAFKHLRAAHELEPTDRLTAGYLALCGARGKPAQPEAKPRNVLWAVRLLQPFTAPGDLEWANLASAIFAEARALDLAIDRDDQLYLCEHLRSVSATDPQAAEAYHHLQATHPQVVTPEYAWLYTRASQQHGVALPHGPELFARTFADPASARAFFAEHGWNFDDLEVTYLEHAAAVEPGAFPAILGADYAPRGEELLLTRLQAQEQAGRVDAALATVETLLKLSPRSSAAHDRLAYLLHKQGKPGQALIILDAWCFLYPQEVTPLLRRAALHQAVGEPLKCLDGIRQALALTSGARRADIAVLGTRWLLKHAFGADVPADSDRIGFLRGAAELLEDGLRADPAHSAALGLLALIRSFLGDRESLAKQANAMNRPEVDDPRFHYAAAICYLAARNPDSVLEHCRRARLGSGSNGLAIETAYLAGWAHAMQEQQASAIEALRQPASSPDSPSAGPAQALLGRLAFLLGEYEEAIGWWQRLDPKKRAGWKLSEALAGAVFLTALAAFQAGRFEEAADKIRQAGRLGFRDPRLGPLLNLALLKAGQRYLYNPLEAVK